MTDFPDDSTIPHDFGMFSDAGDAAVREAVLATGRDLRNGVDRETALAALRDRTAAIRDDHSEIGDTDVGEQLAGAIDEFLAAAGFDQIEARDEVVD